MTTRRTEHDGREDTPAAHNSRNWQMKSARSMAAPSSDGFVHSLPAEAKVEKLDRRRSVHDRPSRGTSAKHRGIAVACVLAALLLIIGVMIGYLATAVISVLKFFSVEEDVHAYVIW